VDRSRHFAASFNGAPPDVTLANHALRECKDVAFAPTGEHGSDDWHAKMKGQLIKDDAALLLAPRTIGLRCGSIAANALYAFHRVLMDDAVFFPMPLSDRYSYP
jgi:hypothetical protein